MTQTSLSPKKCIPCEGGAQPFDRDEAEKLMEQISQWKLLEDGAHIARTFLFPSFMDAVHFVTKIATVAEEENHHPDMKISYRKVTVTLTTHAIHGLSENDFIMAAKIDNLF